MITTRDARAAPLGREGFGVGRLAARLRLWRRLARERRALAALEPRLLRDIGLDAAGAAAEAARPFWDAPPSRR